MAIDIIKGKATDVEISEEQTINSNDNNTSSKTVYTHQFMLRGNSYEYKSAKRLHLSEGDNIGIALKTFLKISSVNQVVNYDKNKKSYSLFSEWVMMMIVSSLIAFACYFFVIKESMLTPFTSQYSPYILAVTAFLILLALYKAVTLTRIDSNLKQPC